VKRNKRKKGAMQAYALSAVIIALIIISLDILFFFMSAPARGNVGGQEGGDYNISLDDDPMLGDANAKVTIVEFSDFECPFCGVFARNTLPLIKQNYIDTGKVRFVFRNYIVHPAAHLAAEAAYCANEQGNDKYWAYNEKLFQNQASLDADSLKAYASGLSLDTEKFNACLDAGKYKAQVDKDTQDGAANGVRGTPTFFINGMKIVGAQPYAAFQQAIEAALNA